ncbi:unnamed protein product [Arctogadus glacialis]
MHHGAKRLHGCGAETPDMSWKCVVDRGQTGRDLLKKCQLAQLAECPSISSTRPAHSRALQIQGFLTFHKSAAFFLNSIDSVALAVALH